MIWCYYCEMHTRTEEPVIIRKQYEFRFHVKGVCENCKRTKAKYLSDAETRRLPRDLRNIPEKIDFIKLAFVGERSIEIFPNIDKIINA